MSRPPDWLDAARKDQDQYWFFKSDKDVERVLTRPLVPDLPAEPFPVDALPPLIRKAVEEVEEATRAPLPMIATCALTAAAAVVQGLVNVRRSATLVGPVALNTITIAASGERKTTVDNLLTAGLREWHARQVKLAAPALQRQAALVDAWTAQEGGIKEAIRKASKDGVPAEVERLTQELVNHALKKPLPIAVPSLLRQDDTPEALASHLATWPVAAVISSEAGLIFGSHGMNPDTVMRNLAQTNVFWEGGTVQRGRVHNGDTEVEGARVTMGLQLQPEAFEAFYDKVGKLARGMGYFARFFVSFPESTQGGRFFEEPPPGMPALAAFNARACALLDLLTSRIGPDGKPCLQEVRLDDDPAVKKAWVGYHDSVEEELGKGRPLYDVQDSASKSADNAARVYGIFLVFEADGAVPLALMVNATIVARWYLNEAQRFQKTVAIPEGVRRATKLEQFLCNYCLENRTTIVPTREVSQMGPAATRTEKPRDEAFELLESHGRGWREKTGRKSFFVVDANVLRKYRDG